MGTWRRAAGAALACLVPAGLLATGLAARSPATAEKYGCAAGQPVALLHPSDGRILVDFGVRRHPLLGVDRMHEGLDYAGPQGGPVRATADGVIETARHDGAYGKQIVIRHAPDLATHYAHLSAFAVAPGDCVAAGAIIGRIGSTGLAASPHLHFEVVRPGGPVDPAPLLPPR